MSTVVQVVRSVPLDPTSTICAIALLLVAALTWKHVLVRDDAAAHRRPARRRRPAQR